MARGPLRRSTHTVEFGTLVGLEDLAAEELRELLGSNVEQRRPGFLRAKLSDLDLADRPRISGVAYLTRRFDVPRPRALLGNEHLEALTGDVRHVVGRYQGSFTSLRLSAAGASSPVMQRLASALAKAADLPIDPEEGDLVIRVYPDDGGWSAAVRLTPRPISARPWQVAGFPGALEATVAAAMVRLTHCSGDDVFVDPCCGSGTLAIERALAFAALMVVAIDIDPKAISALDRNIAAAERPGVFPLLGDAGRLPFRNGGVSVMAANPPWGHQMGTPELTRSLYPALLAEAARVMKPGGRFVLLSHQVRWTQQLLSESSYWNLETERRLAMRGHHPRIWVLTRS